MLERVCRRDCRVSSIVSGASQTLIQLFVLPQNGYEHKQERDRSKDRNKRPDQTSHIGCQGEIRHGGRRQELKQCLSPTEEATFPNPEVNQPGDSMLDHDT